MPQAERGARRALAAWFPERADEVRLEPLGEGHINDTWLVRMPGQRLVLQRINGAVFPDPLGIARKVAAVTAHLRGRVALAPLLTSRAGVPWHEASDGVWRMTRFVPGRTLQTLASDAQAEAAGCAFGRFQRALAGLSADLLAEPIPGFLRLDHYLAELDAALARAPAGGSAIGEAVALIERRRHLAGTFADADRPIHGDCKVNNLLFQRHRDRVVGVLDLDTVMVGHWAWDFGDLVRSAATGARFSVARFAALARGFVGAARVPADVQTLIEAPRYLALMLSVRFLTDHLCGDRYFKVAERGENLARAWTQLDVLRDMEGREAQMVAALAGIGELRRRR
ncbi:MAG: aminoglycoside phosphotransferase family protein [Pseudomonadales bacterium]